MAVKLSKQHHQYLLDVLGVLRAEIEKYPPIYLATIEGIEIQNDDVTMLLASGICDIGQRFFTSYWRSPTQINFLFGNDDCKTGVDRLDEISPQLIDVVIAFSPQKLGESLAKLKESEGAVRSLLAAILIRQAVEEASEYEPESLVLPQVVRGKLSYQSQYKLGSYPGALIFPGGKTWPIDHNNFQEWNLISDAIVQGKASMSLLKTPIIQSAANVISFSLRRAVNDVKAPTQKTEFQTARWFEQHTTIMGAIFSRRRKENLGR
jgi:hypothetical protein